MPRVTLNLYASFRQCAGGAPSVEAHVEPDQTIEQLLIQLNIPLDQVRIIFCDHRLVPVSHRLQGGETVGVFPAIGGG